MKKYVRKEKEEGVSPVIATILMVAITVVLAATLYLMVGNFGGGNAAQAPKVNGQITPNAKGTWVNFTFAGNPAQTVHFTDIKYIDIGTVSLSQKNMTTSTPAAGQWSYYDLNHDGKISDGDTLYIHLSKGLSTGSYTFKLVHANGEMYSGEFSV